MRIYPFMQPCQSSSVWTTIVFLLTGNLVLAQEVTIYPNESEEESPLLDEIVVSASPDPGSQLGLGQYSPHAVRVVETETLRRNATGTLGETLGWEPGVSSSYFTPGASRPVIRGFEGYRVRMLRDDLDTFDLSDISPDHGVALEPFLLESVEIHRGPAALLYGNSAVGGAVNARSRSIARIMPKRVATGALEQRFDSVSSGYESAGYMTLKAGEFLFQLTGSHREAEDIRIPGNAWSDDYEMLERPSVWVPGTGGASGQVVPLENPSGRLPHSFHDSSTWSAGFSWIPENLPLVLGVSYSRFDSRYGMPYIYPGDPTDFFGEYDLDISQDRFDFEGSMDFDQGFVSKLQARLGYGAYRHSEYFIGRGKDEGSEFVDSYFEKDAFEGRIDMHHRGFNDAWTGVIGFSARHEDFTAVRTIYPPPDPVTTDTFLRSDNYGLHALEQFEGGEWTFRLGHRLEYVEVLDHSMESFGFLRGEKDHSSATSGSVTWARENFIELDRLALTGTVSLTERQPSAIERYAFWNNAGIGRFLIGGDLDGTPLANEESLGFEIGVEASRGPVGFRLNAYHYDYENFIFMQEDPAATGGFGKAVRYIGRAATFTGFETELDWKIHEEDGKVLKLTLMSDYVRGTNEDEGQPIPRMPPLRFGSRLEWQDERFTVGLEIRHATGQDRVKPEPRAELPTDAYTMVNMDASWNIPVRDHQLTLFLRATNLLNEEARLSTSFRKDVAPLPGRGLSAGLRYEF
ncbi:TonB-dependent receptor [Luteolibacter sp. SL250]|uniref:TonB-dependent receptor n=1 Tax=Luteolibacter sp. SL250 TaxID=2995170 RepID=UPI002271262D|nr:TonB-dependent receptor [Luteolibacter sp. SL250]WAC21238.1 TonB-dependent receptor [Luteolibacter sp. SL250]